MWLDELNPWVIARDAHSLPQLFANMRYERHPALWYLCLYVLTRFTTNPAAMQALHAAIATMSVALIAFAAPFRLRDRWLLAFSYYFAYEYCLISRGYALGILLLLAVCVLWARLERRLIPIALLLACAANTSAFGLLLASALAAGIMAADVVHTVSRRVRMAAATIFLCGAALGVWSLVPAPDNMFGRELHTTVEAARALWTLGLVSIAWIPLPDLAAPAPWNSSLFLGLWPQAPRNHPLAAIGGAIAVALALWRVRRHRPALVATATGTAALLSFTYVGYSGGYRHHGHFFVLVPIALWMAEVESAWWLSPVLALQVLAGGFFLAAEYRCPFSYSWDLAAFVGRLPKSTPVVVAQKDFINYAGPPLSGYLRRRVYYATAAFVERGSYLKYDPVRRHGAIENRLLAQLTRFGCERRTALYVITNNWECARLGTRLATFWRHLVPDEHTSSVYRFEPPCEPDARPNDPRSTPAAPPG